MDTLWQDLRIAARGLLRAKGFTAVAALAMALGIGGSTAIYAALDGLVLRPLALERGEELVRLFELDKDGQKSELAPGNFIDVFSAAPSLERAAAFSRASWNLVTPDGPDKVAFGSVSADFFRLLRVRIARGRDFLLEEEREENADRIVLTDAAWKRRFSGRADALGQSVLLNGRSHTIVGVLPPGFVFPLLREVEGFVPLGTGPRFRDNHGGHYLEGIGRLKPGRSAEQADAELKALYARSAERFRENVKRSARAVTLHEDIASDGREPLTLAMVAMLVVLLLSCANVAGMLTARGAARRRELAVRAALGGGRLRIARQLVTESALLGLLGGALGLFVAAWGLDWLMSGAPIDTPRLDEVALDPRICALAVAVSLGAGILAGLLPALQASRPDLLEALREGGMHATGGQHSARLRRALVVAQIALSVALTASALLMVASVRRAWQAPPGFDPRGVAIVQLTFPFERFRSSREASAMHGRLLKAISAIPGVDEAAAASDLPFRAVAWSLAIEVQGRPQRPAERSNAGVHWVSPSYRRLLRVPLLAGRDLRDSDTPDSAKVVLVNAAFARRFFPGEDPLGKRISFWTDVFEGEPKVDWWEIAGVVGDMRHVKLDWEPKPEVYLSEAQRGRNVMNLLLRSARPLPELTRAVRAEVTALDPQQPIGEVLTLEEAAAGSLGGRRVQAAILGSAAAVGLLLAALGVYGLLAWSVAQRTREMAIRRALGAPERDVLRMVLFEGIKLAAVGLAIGLLAAIAAGRALRASLYGVSPDDPRTYAAVMALLVVVVVLATLLPAVRAMRVSPMVALRSE